MGKDEFSKAEQYRKERKERLAKEAKKNSKRNAAVAKAKSVALKVCAVIVAVAIVFGIVVVSFNAAGSSVFRSKVATVGNNKISSIEFTYYYRTVYNFYYQYASQGYDLGFDASVSPDEQKYTADDETTTAAQEDNAKEGETTKETTTKQYDTWDDFFIDTTLKQIRNNYVLAAAAKTDGVKLDDSDIKEVDDQIKEMENTAKENGFTLNAYISVTYGSGVNAKCLREFMLKDALSKKYTEFKQDEYAASYSADKVNEEYNSNKHDYDLVDYRSQTFSLTEGQDADTVKASADEFLAKATSSDAFEAAADDIAIKEAISNAKDSASSDNEAADSSSQDVDEESITKQYTETDNSLQSKAKYSDVSSTNEDLAKWLFDTAKTGESKIFTVKTGDTVDVRHILFKFNEDQSTATDEQKAAAKKKAEDALNEWKNGDKTEDSFAAIAKEKSEDEGSATNGGLYEGVTKGQMVSNFNDWIFDSSRKTGDTDIVETEYGYHVMYFVAKNSSTVSSYIVAFCDKAPYKDESYTATIRNMFFSFSTDESEATEQSRAAAKQSAEDALKEWQSGDKTAESFGEIAKTKSADTSSAPNGGLYEDVKQGQFKGTYSDEFENWIFDSSRKAGDCEIIELETGYMLVYYVSKSDKPVWESTIRDALAQEDYNTYFEELSNSSDFEISEKHAALKIASKKNNKAIKRYIYNVERSQAAQQQQQAVS